MSYCSVVLYHCRSTPGGCSNISLCALLGHVPALLEVCTACKYNEKTGVHLRVLRLVNKEMSRVALLAMKSFTLILKGQAQDTVVDSASLLGHTRLTALGVHLRLSGAYILNDMTLYRL